MDNHIQYQHRKAVSIFLNISFLLTVSLYTLLSKENSSSSSTSIDDVITSSQETRSKLLAGIETDACAGVYEYTDQKGKCEYVKSNPAGCRGKGYINYLELFYCGCGEMPWVGYSLLLSWIFLLFYLLADTSTEYFCPSVESLSEQLRLSPTIAGTTLLPFGNGANDVFASIISFTQSTNGGDVGLNSVLGGALFISCFVVGTISVMTSSRRSTTTVVVDEGSFIRDTLFLLFSLSCLLVIIILGSIKLWAAMFFVSVYLVYICTVSAMHFFSQKTPPPSSSPPPPPTPPSPPLPKGGSDLSIPLLNCVDEEKGCPNLFHEKKNLNFFRVKIESFLKYVVSALELPLYLPRRLTIPIISEKKWSKAYGLSAAILAPIFIAILVTTRVDNIGFQTTLATYILAGVLSIILGNIIFVSTKDTTPPKTHLLPWLIGGFLMSIVWTYLLVEELVGTLVSVGTILGINPSILGLTVLAWGNSIADLTSNAAMALHGGPRGVQIAMSGCYAGPLFNTLVGLGLSLVFASWSQYPSPYAIPKDSSLYETVGFLICGLVWALVVLPKRGMKLDKFLGGGLFAIYFCFLFLRLARAFV